MESRQLKYLITLAEYRNVTRAAEALYISQPALSHYLKNTEAELGVQLFDRSTTPMKLTQAGECYIESARRILLEQERLEKELRDITHHLTGKLVLGTSRDRASYLMPRILPRFSQRYPGIEVEVFTASGQKLVDQLKSGRVDLVLLPEPFHGQDSSIKSEHIYREEMVLAARAGGLPEEARLPERGLRLSALRNQKFFLLFPEHTSRSFCDAFFKKHRISPRVAMEFASSISCYRMAATGLGLAVIPYFVTRLANAEGELELFSLGPEPVLRDINIYYRKDSYVGLPERELIELCKSVLSHEQL